MTKAPLTLHAPHRQASASKLQSTYFITKPTTTQTPSSSSSSTSTASSSHSGLSTGAKAGVGVGVAVGVLALFALLVFIFLFMRKRRAAATGSHTEKALEENGSEPALAMDHAHEKQKVSEKVDEVDS